MRGWRFRPHDKTMTRATYQPQHVRLFDWLLPLLACAMGWRYIGEHFRLPTQYDAEHTYLPAARAFFEQGWSFMLTPASYRVVPLGYLWPALWGANPDWIRAANMALWAGCALFLWRATWLFGGRCTAATAMVLLAFTTLPEYFPTELTEPIFLFGMFGMIHAWSRLVIAEDASWGAIAQAAAMLTVTLLSRPVLQLVAPAMLLVCIVILRFGSSRSRHLSDETRRTLRALSLGLGLGLVIPFVLFVKNGLVFGLWGLGTGSGTGLYLGTHPLFQGGEPAYLGFDYDVNSLTLLLANTGDHLSIAGDRAARNAALLSMQSMSVGESINFYARKLWWWWAQHPMEAIGHRSLLRKLRLFEGFAIATTFAWVLWGAYRLRTHGNRSFATALIKRSTSRQWLFAAILLGVLSVMIAQLLPILYNRRYSAALLAPWLIPLAAFSLACLIQPLRIHVFTRKRFWGICLSVPHRLELRPVIGSLAFIVAMTAVSYQFARKNEHVTINPASMGPTLTQIPIQEAQRISTLGMVADGETQWALTESPAILLFSITPSDIDGLQRTNPFNALWDIKIALDPAKANQSCKYAEFAYQTLNGQILQPENRRPLLVPLVADGEFHHLTTHANRELRPQQPGSLRVVLHCPVGTHVRWRESRLLESRYPWEVAAKVQH